jgi:hypothetical protein
LPHQAPDAPTPDLERLVEVLTRHRVEYVLVGGGAARLFGATRVTEDTDCLARRTDENLDRLAAAMRELSARLRVEGLTDEESSALPVTIDRRTLSALEISTWTTDAGWFDVLANIPNGAGERLSFDDVIETAVVVDVGETVVSLASLDVIIASKEWANRPKDLSALPELRRLRNASGDRR